MQTQFPERAMDTISRNVSYICDKMMAMLWKDQLSMFYGTVALFFLLATVYGLSRNFGKKKSLPPGPSHWPVVGSLFSLGPLPHQTLAQLAKQYGGIMSVFFGSVRVVIVSDASMAKELFSVRDASFASRPIYNLIHTAAKGMNFGREDGTVSNLTSTYSPKVREARQLYISELFTPEKLEMSKSKRMEEAARLVVTFKQLALEDPTRLIEIRPRLCEFGLRNSCRTIFNKAFLHSERLPRSEIGLHPEAFRIWEATTSTLFATYNLADIIPIFKLLGKLDVQGLEARWKYVNTLRLSWTTAILEWYRKHEPSRTDVPAEASAPDFVETLLRQGEDGKYTEISIKSLISELLIAGSDTTSTTLEWSLLEIVRHPHVMEKLQAEIDANFGMLRPVEDDEASQLPYLQAVVKEVLRLHPAGVLGIPHCNLDDAELAGYHIPARTPVLANLWAIHRDPNAWGDDALKFNPDRFLGRHSSDLSVNATNYQFIPFSAGRRICPGRPLAMRALHMVVASFFHAFEFSAPPGVELNANEGKTGVNIRPETPLLLRISLRPQATLYSAASTKSST